jgi:hypothetical protein
MSTNGAYDHNSFSEIINPTINQELEKLGLPNWGGVLIRFTANEWSQIISFRSDQIFAHFNLQHYGHPQELDPRFANIQLGVQILRNGSNIFNHSKMPPLIDKTKTLLLEVIELKTGIKIQNSDKLKLKSTIPILHNPQGLKASLIDKYSGVMGLPADKILEMEAYVRILKPHKLIEFDI